MNRIIDIQEPVAVKDSLGQEIIDWRDKYNALFAAVITTGGREFYAAQKLNAETSALFKIRYMPDIKPTMRVKYGERFFNIIHVNDIDEKHEFILLSCKEVV